MTLERDAIRPATGRVHARVSRGCTQHGAGVSRRRARVTPALGAFRHTLGRTPYDAKPQGSHHARKSAKVLR